MSHEIISPVENKLLDESILPNETISPVENIALDESIFDSELHKIMMQLLDNS